jgi:hypothetical protein
VISLRIGEGSRGREVGQPYIEKVIRLLSPGSSAHDNSIPYE